VCVGHSHMQFNIQVEGTVVLNPGSVGLPRDGDPRAAYAIIDDYRIELKRVTYPVEETIARIEAMPWSPRAKEMMQHALRAGRLPGVTPDPDAFEDVESGADVQSLALLPFILKFLGGPLSDRFNLLGFGHRKPYIMIGLVVQSLGLLGLSLMHPAGNLAGFTALALLTVAGLALYDTCCDGMVIDVTPPADRDR